MSSASISLRGKVALVTGASGGIGAACAKLFLEAGARVLSCDLPKREIPPGTERHSCDLADPEAIASMAAHLRKEVGELHLLVHAAGITRDAVLWKMEREAWDGVMAVNLDSGFHLLRTLAPLIRECGGGSVVLVASINGERGKLGQANYAASKAGLIALGKTAAIELGRSGVRVNCIAPGWIDTPMTAALPEEYKQRAIAESALGRTGVPEDVANAALFLCSDLARHITGQVLRVDGGQLTA